MSIKNPYKRTYRPFRDNNQLLSRHKYIEHFEYAKAPEHYVRAYLLLQKDLHNLFDFIEPCDDNLGTHSFRTFELLLRICVEIEANFTAILAENIFSKTARCWNMKDDYFLINKTHFLSKYKTSVPLMRGNLNDFRPFEKWDKGSYQPLEWYQAYNKAKHDRHGNFKCATFKNLIEAFCGLTVILSAQFQTKSFSKGPLVISGNKLDDNGFEQSLGGFVRVSFQEILNIPDDEKYDFVWENIKEEEDPIHKFDYDKLSQKKSRPHSQHHRP